MKESKEVRVSDPPKGRSALFVFGMGILSISPFVAPFLYFAFGVPFFPLLQLLFTTVTVISFALYSIRNKAFSSQVNVVFAVSFGVTILLTVPVYWLFGILVPFLDERRLETVRTAPGRTLLFSVAPVLSIPLTVIWVYFFPFQLMAWFVPLGVALSALFYFSYHVVRHPIKKVNQLLWIVSFFMTGTLSLPVYWFKRIYKTTLFPANIEVPQHELWIDDENDHKHNLDTLAFENTVDMELDFSAGQNAAHEEGVGVQKTESDEGFS